ncbi:uncharacterized protein F4812DRAFT_222112 [Daldinia caldariorum]|uniref:uncharacterized protein n=1 Tax=Daldinia caldariorum TaxID=326644 RepID=UPI002007BAC5|nr:uncharacterized protein F4812DRAFT_222112 [Daldinia caldariorum]KAI1464083.1 hypothetical protein F4812DRAFT_222112 [Daldinia caldariorum]
MGNLRKVFAVSALAAAAARAQDLRQPIVGCADLECPASSRGDVNDNCTVADTGSYIYVGLTRIPTDNDALSGISWSKGFNVGSSDNKREFQSTFYLGTPPDLQLNNSTGACAVFLHGASQNIAFPGEDSEPAQGTCTDALGSSCVDALVSRARTLVNGYNSGSESLSISEACSRLQQDLEDSNDQACTRVSKGHWSNFTSVALTGEGAPQPITQQQNSSSTCWPVIPKQDDLTLVSQYNYTGGNLASELEEAMFAITPIITVFYSAGNGSLATDTEASLSCVKVVGPARASLSTINNGSNDHDGSGAMGLSSTQSLLSAALVAGGAAYFISI